MKGTNNKYRARECSEAMCDRRTVKLLQFLHHEGYGGKAVQETGVHKKKPGLICTALIHGHLISLS